LKRRNSRFLSEEAADEKFRPEFGKDSNKQNEKIWELMSSYIGSD
jgi:hypothetical protein